MKKYLLILVLFGMPLVTPVAQAALSCTFQDSANATLVDFGGYTAGRSTPLLGVGQVTFLCMDSAALPAPVVTYVLAIDQGLSGNFAARELRSGASSLTYNLYTDPTLLNVLGNGAPGSGTSTVSGACALNINCVVNVYGSMEAGQIGNAGIYQDVVTVTITF